MRRRLGVRDRLRSRVSSSSLGEVASPVEQVRLVCNEWGRCWRTGPRYYRYGYYGPRRFYGPGYGYGYYGPRYGYYGGPGIAFGGPGFGLRFGF